MTRLERFNGWRLKWLRLTCMLEFGLMVTVMAGGPLLQERFANAPWRHAARTFDLCAGAFCLLWLLLGFLEVCDFSSRPRPGELRRFLVVVCRGLAAWLRNYLGAASVACVATAAYFWWLSGAPRRSCAIAVAGWLWAALYPLAVPWPNEQRFLLGLVLGGLATALQGILDVAAFLRGKSEWNRAAAAPAE